MKDHTSPTHAPAFLVAIGETHALVDAVGERLLVLNAAGARAWQELSSGLPPRSPSAAAFAAELVALGLLPPKMAGPQGDLVPVLDEDEPRILAQAPLQVAAGTSDPNPFSADAAW